MPGNESEDDLLRNATRRVKAKRTFLAHLGTYLLANAALCAIWAITGGGYPWFVWPALGWGIGVAFHGFNVVYDLDPSAPTGTPRDARAIEREMQRLRRNRART